MNHSPIFAVSASGGGLSFTTIQVPAGTSPVADSATDVLTLTCSTDLTITGNATTDTINFAVVSDSTRQANKIAKRDLNGDIGFATVDCFDYSTSGNFNVEKPGLIVDADAGQAMIGFRSSTTPVSGIRGDSSGNVFVQTGSTAHFYVYEGLDYGSATILLDASVSGLGVGLINPTSQLEVYTTFSDYSSLRIRNNVSGGYAFNYIQCVDEYTTLSPMTLEASGRLGLLVQLNNVNSLNLENNPTGAGGFQWLSCQDTYNSVLAFSIAATGTVDNYGSLGTVSSGIASIRASASSTANSAAKSSVLIYTTPRAMVCRISWVATITRAATTSCVLGGANGFQITFTDVNDSVVKTSNPTTPTVSAVNATSTTISGCEIAWCKASTNLNYSFGYTSVGATSMQYDFAILVEEM